MKKVHKTMRIDEQLVNAINKQAQEEYRSFNNMIEKLLREALGK